MIGVLFVCMGNICRSPLAEGMFRHIVHPTGLLDRYQSGGIITDSAGTTAAHTGEPPDRRGRRVAEAHGFDISSIRSRKVRLQDYSDFDYIVAMDRQNLTNLRAMGPEEHHHKLSLFLDWADNPPLKEVPDPYYGADEGFDETLSLVRMGSEGLLAHILRTHYPGHG